MAARLRHALNQELAQLLRQFRQLLAVELPQLMRKINRL
jgi:hypothetical protein